MADISQLDLNQPEPMDWDQYVDGGQFKLPPPGKYFFQAPAVFKFGATKDKALSAELEPLTIVNCVDPAFNGFEIRFTRVSNKKFTNRKTGATIEASMMGNYLRACGVTAQPQTHAEYAAAVEQTAGAVFEGNLTWEGYDKDTGASYKYKDFPVVNGEKQQSIEVNGKKIFANARISGFVSAVGD